MRELCLFVVYLSVFVVLSVVSKHLDGISIFAVMGRAERARICGRFIDVWRRMTVKKYIQYNTIHSTKYRVDMYSIHEYIQCFYGCFYR